MAETIERLAAYLVHRDDCKKAPRVIHGVTYGEALPPQPCTCGLDAALASAEPERGAKEPDGGAEEFAAYVRRNYPSDTVIVDPDWHAPRLYRAALRAAAGGTNG